jgi:hypothetical protein
VRLKERKMPGGEPVGSSLESVPCRELSIAACGWKYPSYCVKISSG